MRNKAYSNTASRFRTEQSVFEYSKFRSVVRNKAYSKTVILVLLCGTKRIRIQQVDAVQNKAYSNTESLDLLCGTKRIQIQ